MQKNLMRVLLIIATAGLLTSCLTTKDADNYQLGADYKNMSASANMDPNESPTALFEHAKFAQPVVKATPAKQSTK
tara:strand:- start:64931 stop:65158 length:228 start_codon:yes stop_codon:yes gene_type:complete